MWPSGGIYGNCFGGSLFLYTERGGDGMAKRGQPKRFSSEKQLIDLWAQFCDDIVKNEYCAVPTQSEFCRWLAKNYESTDRRTIYNSLNKYFPSIKKEFETIQSDTIMQGGMLGRYNPTMSIFGLKNWCGWGDNAENRMQEDNPDDGFIEAIRGEAADTWQD